MRKLLMHKSVLSISVIGSSNNRGSSETTYQSVYECYWQFVPNSPQGIFKFLLCVISPPVKSSLESN